MTLVTVAIYVLVGAAAGWFSVQLRMGRGVSLITSALLGVMGSFGGGILLNGLGMVPVSWLGSLIAAAFGAAFLLWVVSLFTR